MKKQYKKSNAITLMSLVITIILLIILAGIGINLSLGENGIITKAIQAKEKQIEAEMKEQLQLKIIDIQTENMYTAELKDLENLQIDGYIVKTGKIEENGMTIEMSKNGETRKFLVNQKLEIVSGNLEENNNSSIQPDTKTPIKAFEPTITEVKSHGFTINAETSSDDTNIICYTYIVNGELIKSLNEEKCIVTDLEADKEYEIIVVAVDNLGNSRKSNIVKERTKDEIIFTKEYLEEGQTTGNVAITKNNYNGTDGLSITGTSNKPPAVEYDWNKYTMSKWYKEIDITNYNTLQFYSKKGVDHGGIYVLIDNELIKGIRYTNCTSSWTQYSVDLSEYSGIHTISIMGGYIDNTGNANSNTQYCDIRLNVN